METLFTQVTKSFEDLNLRLHAGAQTMANLQTEHKTLTSALEKIQETTKPQPFWKTLLPFIPVILALVAGIVYISKLPTRDEYNDVRAAAAETRRSLEGETASIKIELARQSGDFKAIREGLERTEFQQQKMTEKLDRALRR